MNGRSCGMNLHRTAGTTQGPGMLSGQHVPPIRAHSGTPGPLSCGSTPSPAIGSLANSLHLKMPSGGGMAPQNNMAESPIHLPALSPRRQVLTNGKPRYQVAPAGGMSGSHTLKPKQQEFGSPFPSNPGKALPTPSTRQVTTVADLRRHPGIEVLLCLLERVSSKSRTLGSFKNKAPKSFLG